MAWRLRVEEQARRLARARREHDGSAADLFFRAVALVDVRNRRDLSRLVRDQLASHGVGEHLHAPRLHRRKDLDVARRVVRRRHAAAAALAAVMARRAPVPLPRRDCLAARHGADVEFGAGSLHEHVMRFQGAGRIEDAVGRAANLFDGAGDADELLGLVVVRREILVADRPVEPESVTGLRLEVVVGEAQRDAAVVIGASAEDARAEPREVAARRDGVRLARELRAAIGGAVGEAGWPAGVGLALRPGAAMWHVVRPHVLLEVADVEHRARLHEQHGYAEIGEDFGNGTAAGSRANDDDVVNRRGRCVLRHSRSLPPPWDPVEDRRESNEVSRWAQYSVAR